MNPTSAAKTGAAGAVTATVVSVIAALVKHYGIDISADAQVSIAVGIVTAAHWLGEQYAKRGAVKGKLISTQTFTTGSLAQSPGTTTVTVGNGTVGGAGGGGGAQ